jgi:hydroxymethylpyrimidine/phosphomethylpyrimidine kinase
MLASGGRGMSVICAVTAQNPAAVRAYRELPAEAIRAR